MTLRDETKIEATTLRLRQAAIDYAERRLIECQESAELYGPPFAALFQSEAAMLETWLAGHQAAGGTGRDSGSGSS